MEPSTPTGDDVLEGAAPPDAPLTDDLLAPLWDSGPRWWGLLGVTGFGTAIFVGLIAFTVAEGVGLWGNNVPVAWALAIVNFVWWIGLGHAGTFISAFLLLLEQRWRGSINRIAEAMTLFAVAIAGLWPLLHLGRPWFFYWLVPYPSTLDVWPQFRSALPWDAAAILTYGTVSFLFWYTGLVPDLASARDRAPSRLRARIYAVFALGWTGSARDWSRHRIVYGLLAALATPLVISVHSIVSLDFAMTQLPGWHHTLYPPYFVAGAIYSGFALVLLLLVPIRRIFGWEHLVTRRHLDASAKITLAAGWIVIYAYVVETFLAWYGGSAAERHLALSARPGGAYAGVFWTMIALNTLPVQLFWLRRFRRSAVACALVGLAVVVGMWLERYVIVITALGRDFLPSSWGGYAPTLVDLGLLGGSISAFAFLFLLFLKLVPAIPIHEMKELAHQARRRAEG